METLIEILDKSVEKNWEIALTNKHLLNLLKLQQKIEWRREWESEMEAINAEINY